MNNAALRAGMTFDSVVRTLGQPSKTLSFVEDRKTYEFTVGSEYPYGVSCTVLADGGLTFISVIREDVAFRIHAA